MLPRNGVLAVRLPKTGVEKSDILFAGMIQSAMPAPCALLNSPDDSYLVRRADGNPPVTDGGE